MSSAALEKLAWILIYSGLLLACLGAFVWRHDTAPGGVVVLVGALDAAAGAVLIWVRSRRQG